VLELSNLGRAIAWLTDWVPPKPLKAEVLVPVYVN